MSYCCMTQCQIHILWKWLGLNMNVFKLLYVTEMKHASPPPPSLFVCELRGLQVVVFMCFSVLPIQSWYRPIQVTHFCNSGYGHRMIDTLFTVPFSQFWDERLRGHFVSKLNDQKSIEPISVAYHDVPISKAVKQRTMPCSRFRLKIGLLEVESKCMYQ